MRGLTWILMVALSASGSACRSAKSPAGVGAVGMGGGLVFSGRRPDGREIALSNRSKWTIQAAGASATLRWQVGEPVQVGGSGQGAWPAAITSLVSGATALARPAGRF